MTAIFLAAATWKWIMAPLIAVVGVAGFVLRLAADALSNFNTGYGPGTRKATLQAFAILATAAAAAIVVGVCL